MDYLNPRKFLRRDYDYTYDHERRQDYYFMRLLYKLVTRFKYDGLPDTIRPEFLEMQLLTNGTVGITKGQDGLISYAGNYGDNLDGYGIGSNYVGANSTESFDKTVGKDCVVGLNNAIRLSEYFYIERYARMLGLVDESLNIQLIASREIPIIEVQDEYEKLQLEKAQKEREQGKTAIFVKQKTLQDLNGSHPSGTNVLNPNSSGIVETLDNLNSFHDDLMKRFMLEMGINISSKDKKAQLTVAEVDSYDDYSLINLVDNFECRKRMIDEVNSMFGLSATVELNEPYNKVLSMGLAMDEPEDENENENGGESNADNQE